MITTQQAAKMLGITPRRVIALIESGGLIAQKVGRQWMVDERSVESRLSNPRLTGRPKLGQKDLLALGFHTLMCRDHAVLDFTYDRESKRARIDRIHEDVAWAPLGVGTRRRVGGNTGARTGKAAWQPPIPNDVDLALWISHRYMPPLRPEAPRLLREAGVASTDELMFGSLGLNLSDQYWFRGLDSTYGWRDVNFFDNGYKQGRTHRSPDNSTPGVLEKHWERRNGENWLIKTSSTHEEREPYNELLATQLMGRLFDEGDFVAYKLESVWGRAVSACRSFATERVGFVSANEVATYAGISDGRDFYREYSRACQSLGIGDAAHKLSMMIVCDHVMANFDRHRANFGLLRDSESLDGWRIAPLFDHGSAFYSRMTLEEMRRDRVTWTAGPFEEYPLLQLARVEDVSWYDPEMLQGFPQEVHDVLASNPNMPEEFAARAAYHVQRNIDAVNEIHAERAH